eukprot:CAMPEP_0175079960 /NCGR_PEP_ID=MMETSP0052_2-20121109/25190_1 /TAXON_ID=51329 ORGANISM="Polytomella parva, Strain SAG 63-3" /NCGR_SAMPLE_ID=MMETSP0052_2 /ASSEMBLY_ACC=CAM_ASM_000194 /LENGTH=617 /DNA_ID=CAMNT_0016350503 /DNA_START=141 /DNA_END=1994 /DNA_ORIENTATION=+
MSNSEFSTKNDEANASTLNAAIDEMTKTNDANPNKGDVLAPKDEVKDELHNLKYKLVFRRKFSGHKGPIISCARPFQVETNRIIATGGEDGRLIVFDMDTGKHVFSFYDWDTIFSPNSSIVIVDVFNEWGSFQKKPLKPIVTKRSVESSEKEEQFPIASLSFHPSNPSILFAAVGYHVVQLDLHLPGGVCAVFGPWPDELNCLAIHSSAKYLAAGDDTGDVAILDLESKKIFKMLNRAHQNICSSLSFRPEGKSSDLLTAGLDSVVAKYDFTRSKCLDRWNMGSLAAATGSKQIFNPPFVHQLAVSEFPAQQRLAAVARGDGALVVLDVDYESKYTSVAFPCASSAGKTSNKGTPLTHTRTHRIPCNVVISEEYGASTAPATTVAFSSIPPCPIKGIRRLLFSAGNDRKVMVWDLDAAVNRRMGDLAEEAATQKAEEMAAKAAARKAKKGGKKGKVGNATEGKLKEEKEEESNNDDDILTPVSSEKVKDNAQLDQLPVLLASVTNLHKINQICTAPPPLPGGSMTKEESTAASRTAALPSSPPKEETVTSIETNMNERKEDVVDVINDNNNKDDDMNRSDGSNSNGSNSDGQTVEELVFVVGTGRFLTVYELIRRDT